MQEYSIQNGIVYRGLRIVPPDSMRNRVLHIIHIDHPCANDPSGHTAFFGGQTWLKTSIHLFNDVMFVKSIHASELMKVCGPEQMLLRF